jgi:hypothetical protein
MDILHLEVIKMTWEDILKKVSPVFQASNWKNPRELTSLLFARNIGSGVIEMLYLNDPWFLLDGPFYDEDIGRMLYGDNHTGDLEADLRTVDEFFTAFKEAFNITRINRGRSGISNTMVNMLLDKLDSEGGREVFDKLKDFIKPQHHSGLERSIEWFEKEKGQR